MLLILIEVFCFFPAILKTLYGQITDKLRTKRGINTPFVSILPICLQSYEIIVNQPNKYNKI